MKSIEELKSNCKNIDDEIILIDKFENVLPLIDGIINPENYLNSKYKILWILKEPYDGFDEVGNPESEGGDYREWLSKNLYEYKKYPTWRRIAYTSFGILNNISYDDMDDLQKKIDVNDNVFDVIRNIAFINVKKTPGKKGTTPSTLKIAYDRYKEVLLKQIRTYDPDIIIGGYTLPLFLKDLGLTNLLKTELELKYYLLNSKLFIDTYHPSYNSNSVEHEKEYVDGIVSLVRATREKLSI